MTLEERDLYPSADCPKCGEPIVTWWADDYRNPDEEVRESRCWLHVDDVEPTPPRQTISGNIIIIEHDAPSLSE